MRINWLLITLAFVGLFVYGLVDNSRGPVFPDILTAFKLTDAEGSVFFFISSFAATVSNAAAFYWLKKWPAMRAYFIYAALMTTGLVLVAMSPNFTSVLCGAFLFGLSMGGLGLLVNIFASQAAGGKLRRRVMSGLHGMYGISSLLAPLVVTGIYSMGGDWRWAIGSIGMLPLLVGLYALIQPEPVLSEHTETKGHGSVTLAKCWPYVGMVGSYVVAEVLLGTRLVLYSRRDLGFTVENANFLLSGFFLAMFIGRMLFATISFRTNTHRLLVISAASGLLCYALGLWVSPLAFVGCGFTFSFFYPCAMADVSDRLGPKNGPVVMSWIQSFQSLAIMSMHFIVGVLSDRYGLTRALWVGIAALVIVLLCLSRRVSLGETPSRIGQ
jgi:FHS family glucose/mannose:H+ symporter-like MFS transporter